jgi:hypothetical protein
MVATVCVIALQGLKAEPTARHQHFGQEGGKGADSAQKPAGKQHEQH